jgi:fucose permease
MIGLATCGFTLALSVFVVGSIVYGVGFGMSDATLTAAIRDASGHSVGRALTLSQIPFGVGALMAPPLVSVLLQTYLGWRGAYLGAAAVVGLAALLIALVRFPEHGASRTKIPGILRAATRPVPILLGAVVSMYFGMQIGFGGFLPAHLEATLNFERSHATTAVAVYWAGVPVGRVLGVWLASRVQPYDLAAGSLSLALVAALIAAAAPHTVVILISVMFAGVAIGPLFTIVMGIGVRGNPATAGSIAGLILAIGSLSSVGLWLFMGVVADELSVQAAIGLVPLFMGTGLVFLLLARAHERSRDMA